MSWDLLPESTPLTLAKVMAAGLVIDTVFEHHDGSCDLYVIDDDGNRQHLGRTAPRTVEERDAELRKLRA